MDSTHSGYPDEGAVEKAAPIDFTPLLEGEQEHSVIYPETRALNK